MMTSPHRKRVSAFHNNGSRDNLIARQDFLVRVCEIPFLINFLFPIFSLSAAAVEENYVPGRSCTCFAFQLHPPKTKEAQTSSF